MRSSGEIRMDFQNALEQARRLEELADSLDRRVTGRLEETGQSLRAVWKGDSGTRYAGKTQELRRQVRRSAQTLRDTAGEIRRIARSVYEAEMRALEIARNRTS